MIQLHPQVLNTCFPLDLVLSENEPRVLKGSPVRDKQSLGFLTGHFQASGILYHPPVVQIVIYYSQQVIWNLFPHHGLDADIPPCGIERIAYVNDDQRAEFLAFMAMLTTAWIASTVDLPFLNLNWFPERPLSPTNRA